MTAQRVDMDVVAEAPDDMTQLSNELQKSYKTIQDRFYSMADLIHNGKVSCHHFSFF